MELEGYETMHRVLERSKVLNDLIQAMELDTPLTPAALEEIEAYRVRRYAEECFYRETLNAPDLELYDSYELKHSAGMLAALAAGANPDLPICWRMMVRLFAKRARKISPKPCIIWCMIAEHLWKKSMMTGVLSFMRLNMTLWTVPVSC